MAKSEAACNNAELKHGYFELKDIYENDGVRYYHLEYGCSFGYKRDSDDPHDRVLCTEVANSTVWLDEHQNEAILKPVCELNGVALSIGVTSSVGSLLFICIIVLAYLYGRERKRNRELHAANSKMHPKVPQTPDDMSIYEGFYSQPVQQAQISSVHHDTSRSLDKPRNRNGFSPYSKNLDKEALMTPVIRSNSLSKRFFKRMSQYQPKSLPRPTKLGHIQFISSGRFDQGYDNNLSARTSENTGYRQMQGRQLYDMKTDTQRRQSNQRRPVYDLPPSENSSAITFV
ncbi:uncharacterized protein [Watersipora subatra]|uniref:uncharacterized protein n=1 Tax=Watersipora subatra TaxID=2589382 RepID=UPI00355BB44E